MQIFLSDTEYILVTAERGQSGIYHTRLTILKRPGKIEYMGELYMERDYREEDKNGSTYRWSYIGELYKEILTYFFKIASVAGKLSSWVVNIEVRKYEAAECRSLTLNMVSLLTRASRSSEYWQPAAAFSDSEQCRLLCSDI